MMISCMIVDDEQSAIDTIASYADDIPNLQVVFTATNPLHALCELNSKSVDIVFLDIQMPQITGIEFMKTARGKAHFILCTAYSEYALESFEYDVIDYLLKPVVFPRFFQAVEKARQVLKLPDDSAEANGGDFFFIRTETRNIHLKINHCDICYIQSVKNYVVIKMVDGKKHITRLTMHAILEKLPSNKFIRVHKSFIVPVGAIKAVENNSIILVNNANPIPISNTYRNPVFEVLQIGK